MPRLTTPMRDALLSALHAAESVRGDGAARILPGQGRTVDALESRGLVVPVPGRRYRITDAGAAIARKLRADVDGGAS